MGGGLRRRGGAGAAARCGRRSGARGRGGRAGTARGAWGGPAAGFGFHGPAGSRGHRGEGHGEGRARGWRWRCAGRAPCGPAGECRAVGGAAGHRCALTPPRALEGGCVWAEALIGPGPQLCLVLPTSGPSVLQHRGWTFPTSLILCCEYSQALLLGGIPVFPRRRKLLGSHLPPWIRIALSCQGQPCVLVGHGRCCPPG